MAIDEAKFKQLCKRAEAATRDRDKAEGALAASMEKLQSEFGCKTLVEAEGLLTKKRKAAAKAEAAYEKAVVKFEKEWGDYAENKF